MYHLLTKQQTDVRGFFQEISFRHCPACRSHKRSLPSFDELIWNSQGRLMKTTWHTTVTWHSQVLALKTRLAIFLYDTECGEDLPHSLESKRSRWSNLCESEGATWSEQQETHSHPTASGPETNKQTKNCIILSNLALIYINESLINHRKIFETQNRSKAPHHILCFRWRQYQTNTSRLRRNLLLL